MSQKWSLPSLNLDRVIVTNKGFQSKINNRMAKSADPDEMARHEASHLDLHCLQRYMYWSAGIEGLIVTNSVDPDQMHSAACNVNMQ